MAVYPHNDRSDMYLVLPHGCDDFVSAFCGGSAHVFRVSDVDLSGGKPPLSAEPGAAPDMDRVHGLLKELGFSKKLQGHRYVVDAIVLVAQSRCRAIALTKQVYPVIAQKYGASIASVERGIRYAIEQACARCDEGVMAKYFGSTTDPQRGKLTNGEFIMELAHLIRAQPVAM